MSYLDPGQPVRDHRQSEGAGGQEKTNPVGPLHPTPHWTLVAMASLDTVKERKM